MVFLLCDLLMTMLCIYWLITFWRHRHTELYKFSLKVRRPFYILLSYALILPSILGQDITTIHLYFAEQTDPSQQYDGEPIIYSHTSDLALHFLHWFAFWIFFQLKIFKFCYFNSSSQCVH